ncbi:MAG: zinc ribbon domain-containing protein, partial [Candidatus Heimdallarchaeaceae archaeon]
VKRYCTRLSTILTKRFKALKRKNTQTKDRIAKENKLTKTVYEICDSKELSNIDLELWQLMKSEWIRNYMEIIRKSFLNESSNNFIQKSFKKIQQKKWDYFVKSFLYPSSLKVWISLQGNPKRDFFHFFEKIVEYHLTQLISEELLRTFLPHVRKILLEIKEKPQNFLKNPEFRKMSIPLGIDDGQVYSLSIEKTEVYINISLRIGDRQRYRIESSRFFEILELGGTPLKGTLMVQGGKLKLAMPFSIRLPKLNESKPKEMQKVLSCDLGLKTFVTMSLLTNDIELDRKFLDQKQLNGLKNRWFLPVNERNEGEIRQTKNIINYKRKLVKLNLRSRKIQADLDELKRTNNENRKKKKKYPKYFNTREYWFLRRSLKQCWEKINNIHNELIHQISTRVVEYAKHTETDIIKFEDLRWTKHSSKMEVGYFLATWQIHWFFSKVINFTASLARRNGIRTNLANPYKSSQICSRCGKEGKRKAKVFVCINKNCSLVLDSDLNASRNLGKISRQNYPLRL